MSSLVLALVSGAYRHLLNPIAPFTWFGLNISTLDISGALRLCIVLRQLREISLQNHLKQKSSAGEGRERGDVEQASYAKSVAVTLVVVHGGEAIMNPWLGSVSPSFVYSPLLPGLYTALTLLVESLPSVPSLSLRNELPLSFFDGFTRALLVCQFIPPVVTTHTQPIIANSPWTLLLTSLITANGGFFLVNLFSMLSPMGWSLATPSELCAYGWTSVDLWSAPLTTALFAFLTHAQPFWAELHGFLVQHLGPNVPDEGKLPPLSIGEPIDVETARAACAIFLATLFATRTVRNFGGPFLKVLRGEKKRVVRSKVDGRRLKTKIQ